MHIYIPSKGRPNNLTSTYLTNAGIPHHVFVEPQEVSSYQAIASELTTIHALPENNRGISYSRNAIFDYALANSTPHFYMWDDDLIKLTKLAPDAKGKWRSLNPPTPLSEILEASQQQNLEDSVAYSSYTSSAFAAFGGGKRVFCGGGIKGDNKTCGYGFVWINTHYVGDVRYRDGLQLCEDGDFIIRLLLSSPNVRVSKNNLYSYYTPPVGGFKGVGGLSDEYRLAFHIREGRLQALCTMLDELSKELGLATKGLKLYVHKQLIKGDITRGNCIQPCWGNLAKLQRLLPDTKARMSAQHNTYNCSNTIHMLNCQSLR